jgi:hypothetical protein
VEGREHRVGVLLVDPAARGLRVERLLEADVDGGAGSASRISQDSVLP